MDLLSPNIQEVVMLLRGYSACSLDDHSNSPPLSHIALGKNFPFPNKGAIKASLGGCTSPHGQHEILADLRQEGPACGAWAVGTCQPRARRVIQSVTVVCPAVGEEEGRSE